MVNGVFSVHVAVRSVASREAERLGCLEELSIVLLVMRLVVWEVVHVMYSGGCRNYVDSTTTVTGQRKSSLLVFLRSRSLQFATVVVQIFAILASQQASTFAGIISKLSHQVTTMQRLHETMNL